MVKPCLFCDIQKEEKEIFENEYFFSFYDELPVSKGHSLIIPKRHINNINDLSEKELVTMHEVLKKTKEIIIKKFKPNGFNIGINEGLIAGQSIMHLHIHLIPRYKGDIENPKGGVRNILSGGDYTNNISKKRKKYL